MALTGNFITPDGTVHPEVFAQVYPLHLQTLPGDEWAHFDVHVWHSAEAKTEGRAELMGFPRNIQLSGAAMLYKLVAIGQAFAAVAWSDDPAIAAEQAQQVIITAIEDAAMEQVPGLARA